MDLKTFFRNMVYGSAKANVPPNVVRSAMLSDVESGIGAYYSIMPPSSAEQDWELLDLSESGWVNMSPSKIMDVLANASPEIGAALFDFLRMINGGWEIEGLDLKGNESAQVQSVVNEVLMQWRRDYKAAEIVINKMVTSLFLRGAIFFEVVFDDNGKYIDWKVHDPSIVRFRKINDEIRGTVYQIGLMKAGKWFPLDYPNIFYMPNDPLPNSPYGRPIITGAIYSAIFVLGVMRDMRRVISKQGYNRTDITVDLQKLQDSMPPISSPDEFEKWVGAIISQVNNVVKSLEPDDTFIHTDVVTVNRALGNVDSSSVSGVDTLIRAIERQLVRALRTMPLMLGINETVSETHAKLQWQIYVKRISAVQHLIEQAIESAFGVVLQAAGIQGKVKWRFAKLAVNEKLYDLQVEKLDIENAWQLYQTGAISFEEYAMRLTGSAPATSEPPALVNAGQLAMTLETRAVQISPNGSNDPLPPIPSGEDDYNFEDVQTDWDKLMPDYRGLLESEIVE